MKKKFQHLIVTAIILIIALFGFIQQQLKLRKIRELKPGTIFLSKGYLGDNQSRIKLLAINKVNDEIIYSLQIERKEDNKYITATKNGQKIDVSGIDHLPVTEVTFVKWDIDEIIGFEKVEEDELEGYKMWKEVGAGGF